MDVTSVWTMDKERELDLCFSGSNEKADHNHPAWGYIETLGASYVGGTITVATLPKYEKHND